MTTLTTGPASRADQEAAVSIVSHQAVPPIWRPIARFRLWHRRRVRARAVADFSSYLMPIIHADFPVDPINELVQVQPMSVRTATAVRDEHRRRSETAAREIAGQMSDEAALNWNIVYRRTRWWSRLWRWAKGSPASGCCR